MSHFAKVVDGKVTQVIVAEPEFFDTFVDSSPGTWIQTSYNTHGNQHPEGKPLRGNYAGIGFYAPKPSDTAVLNKETWLWEDTQPQEPTVTQG